MTEPVVYAPADRPLVEVEVDGTWHDGDLRMWTSTENGWVGQVTWSRAPGENLISSFPADRIRQATT
jgi:hypothetical protein